jgi:hypothetical protein
VANIGPIRKTRQQAPKHRPAANGNPAQAEESAALGLRRHYQRHSESRLKESSPVFSSPVDIEHEMLTRAVRVIMPRFDPEPRGTPLKKTQLDVQELAQRLLAGIRTVDPECGGVLVIKSDDREGNWQIHGYSRSGPELTPAKCWERGRELQRELRQRYEVSWPD